MAIHTRFPAALAVAGTLAALGAGLLAAQERRLGQLKIVPVAPKTPVVVVSGRAQPGVTPSRDRSSPPVALSPTQKAEIFSAALDLRGLVVAGIGAGIRLTPSQPFLPGKGRLDFSGARVVLADDGGGKAEMFNYVDMPLAADGSKEGATVDCTFRPTVANQALLVDVSVWVNAGSMKTGRVRLFIPGGSFDQTVGVPEGAHHLTAIYKPTDVQEKSLVVSDTGYGRGFTFYACEITPLLQS